MRLYILFLLLLVPLAHAETQLSAVENNITYFLGKENVSVKEDIILKNRPFSVTSPIYYHLGTGAESISVEVTGGADYKIDETYGGVIFNFRNAYATQVKIKLLYSYPQSLRRSDGSYLFAGEALKRVYPWGINVVNLRFVLPPGFTFGEVSPEPQERGESYLLYRITYLDARAYEGFPVSIEYANYRELAEKSLSLAKAREHDTFLAVKDANQSIENARSYGANLSQALASFNEALTHLQNYFQLVKQAELILEKNSYEAYRKASSAVEELELAGIKAREAYSRANFAIQLTLEKRLATFEENLTSLSKEEPEVQRVVVVEQPAKGINLYKYAFFALAVLFIIFIASEAYRILTPKSYRRRSSVKDFRVIGDLKRKTFNGFEKKVAKVKRGVDLAQEIRNLRKRREKLKLGIENARKKFTHGEITAELYELERGKFEREIEEIDRKIALLEKELSEIKRHGHEEGKAD
jgi:predicted  nucleic acid-binding Zn-ribbon protein